MNETNTYTRLGSWRDLEGKTIKAAMSYVVDWNRRVWPLILVTEDGGFLTAYRHDSDDDGCISTISGGPSGDPDALHEFAHPSSLLEHGLINSGECQHWMAVKNKLEAQKRADKAADIREQICRLQQELNQMEGSP